MKLIIQRVLEAKVEIDKKEVAKINQGLLVLIGINGSELDDDISWLINKLANLRIFGDNEGRMNLSVTDVKGGILVVPNFTLYADCRKGFRPSFINAAKPEEAEVIFDNFVKELKNKSKLDIQTGVFGADMKVSLTNDGPVTIEIER